MRGIAATIFLKLLSWPMILVLATLGGCASTPPQLAARELVEVPLPSLAVLKCCWQSEEKVTIQFNDSELTYLTVVARQPEQLTVVVLDAFGRRQITLARDDNGTRVLAAPPNWDESIAHAMLVGIFLHQRQSGPWLEREGNLQVKQHGRHKALCDHGRELASLDYKSSGSHAARTFRIVGQPLVLDIATLNNHPL